MPLSTRVVAVISVLIGTMMTACISQENSQNSTQTQTAFTATRTAQASAPSVPRPQSTSLERNSGFEERCITQFLIMNNRGRYAPEKMSDADYIRAVESLHSKPLLTRSQCVKTWDEMD